MVKEPLRAEEVAAFEVAWNLSNSLNMLEKFHQWLFLLRSNFFVFVKGIKMIVAHILPYMISRTFSNKLLSKKDRGSMSLNFFHLVCSPKTRIYPLIIVMAWWGLLALHRNMSFL
jgi:hypothetical protein